jgi:hypothetical protein
MVLKIFKAMWFLSVLAVFVNLLYIYAGLPELVAVFEEGPEIYSIGRDTLFYSCIGVIGVSNLFVFLISKTYYPNEDFRSWIHGLVISLNIFFITCISFIGVYNSAESFVFSRAGIVIYTTLAIIGVWTISWPFYLLYRKYFPKPLV